MKKARVEIELMTHDEDMETCFKEANRKQNREVIRLYAR